MKKAAMQAGICGLIASTHLFSNPTGPLITSGDVSVDVVDAHHLHVDSRSERSIITWDSFSIDATDCTYFHLPDSSSAVLNKVSSNLPSTLAGLLESNGHVYLLNPNGVLVTKEGVINTASFLASTLDVNNDFFLRGEDLLFAGTSQESVINQGKITSWQGDVVLLGFVVRNEGEINAVNGVAALGAGTEILLTPHADYRIAIQVPVADLGHGDVGIAQEGIITALQTELKTSGNAYALAIHNGGKVNATSFEKTAGRVYLIADKGLVSHTGTITAIGADTVGGDVQILGERVALTEGAIVDVSGDFGGGSLLVGGDYRGANPAINNAMHTFVENGVTLTADALQSGNGGQVIIWGVESAGFFGFASAQGGPLTGSGGFIEVSSVNSLQYNGLANTLATNGATGMLLLDPTDVNIVTAGAGLVLNGVSCFADTYCGGCTGLAAAGIDPVIILAQLLLTDVTIDASSGAGAGAGSITITNGFDTTGTANDLTLIALTDVDINDDVIIGGTGNFFIYAGSNNDGTQIGTGGAANLGTIGGVITLAAGTTLETISSGNITLVTSFTSNLDGIVIDGTLNSSGSGGVFMQTYFGGNIHFSATGLLTSSGSSQFSFSAVNDILFDGATPITFTAGSGTLQLDAGNSAQCGTGAIDVAGILAFNTGTTGGLSFDSNAGVTLNTINYDSTAGSTIFSSANVNLNGPINIGTTTVNEFLIQGGLVVTASADISVNTTAPVIGAGNHTLRLLSSQFITVDAAMNISDEASLRLTAQVISFNGIHTSTFNTNGAIDIFSASGSATTNIGDGTNAYDFVHQGLGIVTFNGSNVLMNSPSTITANNLSSQLQFTTRLSALSGTTITFDVGSGGINMTKGCSLSGVLDYHTANAFTAATTANPLTTGTTGVLTFDGGGTVSFTGTGGSIQFNNQGVNSFLVTNGTTLVVTQTTGPISMGTMARIDYTSSPNLAISTTSGSINLHGTSLINFNPSVAAVQLNITSTDGNINVGSITYAAGTGTGTISSTNGGVGQNAGGLLDWSSATAGGLVFSGGSGVSINGDINYTTTNAFSMTTTVAGTISQGSASIITVNAGASGLVLNATNTAGSNAIDIAGDINYSSANDFDFNVASGNVALESTANISMLAGSGSLNIGTAGTPLPGTIISTGSITYSSGVVSESLSMVAVQQITTGNISITADSTNLIRSTTNDISTDSPTTINSTAGSLTMNAPLGDITTNGTLSFSGGPLTLTCQDDININNITTITGSSALIATTSAGNLHLNAVLTVNTVLAVGAQLTASLGGITVDGAGVTFTGGAFVLSSQNDININSTSSFTGNSRFSMTSATANVNLSNSLSVDSTNATASQFISTLGDVNINNSITYSGALNVNPLTITAQNNVSMNNTFSYLSSGLCTITATTGILGFNVVTFPAGGTGGLTGSADLAVFINGPMVFDSSGNCSLTAITGPLLVNATFDLATTGQLDLHAGQDLFIINALTNTLAGDMFFSGGTIFRIEPVLFGVQGSISSAGGDITIGGVAGTTGMVRLQGSSNPGFINSNGGAISITSTSDAFLIDNVSIDSGAGSYNLNIGGALSLLAAANTIITGTSGVVAVTDNLLILADSGGSSQITAAGNVTITSGDSIYLIGFPATAQTASINSSAAGNVSVSTTGGAGTLEIRDSSNITTTGVGTITLAAAGHVIIDNNSRVQTTGTGLITVGTSGTRIAGDITVSGGISGASSITATTGGISIFTANSILMGGVSAVNRATITASGGSYTLDASKSILMNPFATASLTAGAGAFTITAVQDILMMGGTLLTNSGTGLSTITMSDGTFMSGSEGVTTITAGTGAFSMTASNKITFSSTVANLFTVTTGGNATITSTSNTISLLGSLSVAARIMSSGILTLSANQNIDILNNTLLSATGNMNLTTTIGDVTIMNVASISTLALFTATTGGDFVFKASEAVGSTFLSGGTGVTLAITGDLYAGTTAAGTATILASSGDLNVTAKNCYCTGDLVTRTILNANAGNVIFTITDQMILDFTRIAAVSPGNVTVTVTNANLSVINGGAIQTFGTGTTICNALNGAIYIEGGPTMSSTIQGGSGGLSVQADRIIMDAQNTFTATMPSSGPVTIIANTIFALDKLSSVSTSGASALSVTVTTGDLICNRGSSISRSGTGTLTIAAPTGDVIVANNSTISNTGTGLITIGTVGTRIGGNVFVLGGVSGTSSILALTGGVSIFTANTILVEGISSTNRGDITATGGIYTLNASGSIILNAFSRALLTGGSSALTVTATREVFMAGNALLTNNGTGTSTITMADGTFMSGPEGGTTITTGTGALSMTASDKISMSSTGSSIFTVTTGGNATFTSTLNSIVLTGSPSAVARIITTGVLSLSASRNIDILNNASLSSTGNMNLTTTTGDLAIQNVASISAGALFTGTIGGDFAMKSSEAGGTTTLTGGTGVTFNITNDFYVAGAAGTTTITATTGDLNVATARNCFLTGSTVVRPNLTASAGNVIFNVTEQMIVDYSVIFAAAPGNVTITVTNDNLSIINGAEINTSGAGTTTCSALNASIYMEGGPTLSTLISGGSGGVSLIADRMVMDAQGAGIANTAQVSTAGPLSVVVNTVFAMDKTSTVTATGAGALGITVTTGDFICNRNSTISQTGSGTLTIAAPLGNAIISGGNGNTSITTTTGTLTISASKIDMISGLTPGSARVTSAGNIIFNGSDQITLSGAVSSTTLVSTTLGSVTINASRDLNILDNSSVTITGVANANALNLNVTGDLIVSNLGTVTHSGTGIITAAPNIGGNLVVKGGPLGNSVINAAGGTLSLTTLGNVNLEAVSTGTAGVTSLGSLTLVSDNMYANGYLLLATSKIAQISSTNGPLALTANNDLILQNNAQVFVAMGALALQANATAGNLVVSNGSFIEHQGTGSVSSTVGANAHVFGGVLGDGTISGNAALTFTVTGLLDIQAGSGFQGEVLSNGLTSVTAGSINMRGDSLLVRALLEDSSGNLTVNAGLTTLNAHTTLSLTGGAGSMLVTLTDDLIVANDSIIQNSSTGTMTISTTGTATLLAGAGDAIVQGSTNTSSLTADNNIFVLSDLTGAAEITSAGDLLVTATNGNIYIIGSPQGPNASTINSTGGALTVLADHNVILNDNANIEITAGTADVSVTATNGDLIIQNDSFVQNLGTGSVLVAVGENILISGGSDGDSFIADTGPMMLTVPGSLEVEALSGSSGYISSDGNTTITAGRVSIVGFSMAVPAYISDASGSLSISGSNVDLNNFAQIFLSAGAGTLTVDSTGDLRIADASFIQHQGTGLTTSTVTATLYIEGGPNGAASLLGGTGGVTVAANAILLDGFSSVNNAQISATQGNLSVTSTLETALNPHAQIMLAGGTGTYLMTVGDGLLVGSDSILQNAGTGTTTVNVTGVTVFSAGSGSARLLGSTGVLTLTSTDSLQIIASEDAIASITSSGQINISSVNDVTLLGSVVGPRTALIQTTTNTLSVTGGQNVALLNNARIVTTGGAGTLTVNATVGNLTLDNQASIHHTGTGTISASVGRDVVINGGLNGDSFIRANSAGLNFAFTGALAIQSLSGNNGFIQSAGLSSVSASKISIIGFSAAIPAFIQNSSGNLTVSAGSIEMVDFAQIKITAGSGTLAVNTTSGDLRIGNNSVIQNSGTGPTTSIVNRSLYVEGGPGGASSFLGGNGGLNIAAGSAIQMSGFTSPFNALISTVQGGLTISSGQETSLNPHSSITISNVGTASALQMTVGSDLLVMDNSIIRHFGTGTTTINVTGVANILAGTGNATIRGGLGAMTITATDNINILSDTTGVASIQNTGNLSVSTTQDISIVGSPGGIQNAFIQTGAITNPTLSVTSHYLTIRDGGDIAITTGSGTLSVTCTQLSIEDNAFVQQQGTGSFNGMISGDCILRGGPAGPATLLVHSPLTLMIGGDLKIEADANSLASISSQGATSISASRIYMIGFSDTFNAAISNTTGSLTVSAASVNLIDFGQIQLTGGAGTLTVNTTSGDLRIANGSFIRHQGTGALASTINQTLYIEGGPGNKAFYTSGSGGINVSANALIMNGFSSGNNALISATTGNVTLSTTATMNLNPFATVSITGAAGSGILNVSAGTDLLVANGSTLLNSGLGATTVNVTGVATFLGGAGDSSLKGNTGALSLTVGDNLHIISDILGRAFIQNSGNITVMVGSDVHVIGSPEAALTSSIQTSAGTLSVTAANNIIVEDKGMIVITAGAGTLSVTTTNGDLFIENDSSIQQQGTGTITASVGGNAVIKSGSSGNGFISTNSTLNVTVSKDLLIEDVQGLQAFIASNGLTSISSNRLFMIGFDSTHQAYIQNGLGNLTVSATSVRMFDFAKIRMTGGSGVLTVQATAGELRLANGSFIQNSGTGSTSTTAARTLYVEGGLGGASSIQGGNGGLSVSAESILMNGYSALNNALISAANGALNVTTTGANPFGMLNMTPNSKIILNAGAGNVTVTVGGNFYRSGGPTITTSGTGTVNIAVAGPVNCSCP